MIFAAAAALATASCEEPRGAVAYFIAAPCETVRDAELARVLGPEVTSSVSEVAGDASCRWSSQDGVRTLTVGIYSEPTLESRLEETALEFLARQKGAPVAGIGDGAVLKQETWGDNAVVTVDVAVDGAVATIVLSGESHDPQTAVEIAQAVAGRLAAEEAVLADRR